MTRMRILCACLGNSERSPFMAAILAQLLRNQGKNDILVESAGVLNTIVKGDPAPPLSIAAGRTYGLRLDLHRKKHIIDIVDFDAVELIVAADKETQAALLPYNTKNVEVICLNLDGRSNPWKSQNPRNFDDMITDIYAALIREVIQYRFRVEG